MRLKRSREYIILEANNKFLKNDDNEDNDDNDDNDDNNNDDKGDAHLSRK